MEKLDISHIERPDLPWRKSEQRMTECGLAALSYPTITRKEFVERWKEWGRQRTGMMTCVTCFQTAQHYAPWERDPLDGIERAMRGERHYRAYGSLFETENRTPAPNTPLRLELRAMAILVERHKGEFEGLLTGLGNAIDLNERRLEQTRKRREERAAARRPSKW